MKIGRNIVSEIRRTCTVQSDSKALKVFQFTALLHLTVCSLLYTLNPVDGKMILDQTKLLNK